MTPVQSPDAGPANLAGPATAAPGPASASTGARPVGAGQVLTAENTAPAQPVAPHGRGSFNYGGGRRIVLAAAVAGALLTGGAAWIAGSGDGAAGPPTIQITAFHSRFEPDRVTVKPGSTVRFVIHNADPIDHEFIIGPPETHDIHERGEPRTHGEVPGEVTVPAGTTKETVWTFGPAGSPDVAYGCHLAGHWDYGMHGKARLR